jgi:nitrogen fixation NifU-like protein
MSETTKGDGEVANLGEMADADAVGTVGSPDCGDMLRMWVKFKEDAHGRKVIDRATFQTFGCQTAIAVASAATRLIAGRTPEEALRMSGEELSAPLGPLPPMKIHCAQLVEGALKSALESVGSVGGEGASEPRAVVGGAIATTASTLKDSFLPMNQGGSKPKIVFNK